MQLNYYKSIDELPVKIWFDIFESSDLRKLLIDKVDINVKIFNELESAWEKMFNEWIERFDFSEEYKEHLDHKIKIAELQADFIISGDKYLKTMIRIEKEVLKSEQPTETKPFELESVMWKMSKFYGFKLNSRELTVVEYYSAINEISNGR